MVDMYPENEVSALKTVDGRVVTDAHTDTQTDGTNYMIVAHRDGQL